MTQPPQPTLDPQLSEEFPAAALASLDVWCQNSGTQVVLDGFLRGGKTTAEVAVVRVYEGGDPKRKVLKHCPPPEGGVSLDARKYKHAETANEKFTEAHLAKLDKFITDGLGGIFLLMEWRGGGSRNYRPLTSFLDRQTLGVACRAIVKSTLIDWQKGRRPQPNRGGVTAHEVLQAIAGKKCQPGRSLHKIACDLEISEADRFSVNGKSFANVFRAVSQGEGFTDFPTAGIRGNGHGDLHPGNILVPSGARPGRATEQFDEFYLIDLSSFDDNRFLAIDPAHLMLSLANERLSELNLRQRNQLRELILDPDEADAGSLPFGIADAVRAITKVGREHYDGRLGLFEDWYQETLLAIAGCALLFVGRNGDVDTRWWFLQLGGTAIDKVHDFAVSRLGERATGDLPHGTTVTKTGVTPGSPARQEQPARQDPPTRQERPTTREQQSAQGQAGTQEQTAKGGTYGEVKDDNLVFVSAVARRFNELRLTCSRLCTELTEAADGLEPYLARSRGIPGTGMVRDVLGDLTHSVAALRSWQEESPFRQRLSVDSAIALVEARLSTAAELAHEISVSGSTPTLKNNLIRAVEELKDAFQYFFALIVPDQGDRL
jgi:hypothetical protein